MRRISAAELMLLVTVSIWAFNFTVTRYLLTHGFEPLAYSAMRFGTAALVVSAITLGLEGSLRFELRHAVLLGVAAMVGIYLNQVAFVYAIDLTNASTTALIFGSLPILTALFAYWLGVERLHRRFWIAAALSFGGVALVAVGSGDGFSGNLTGDVLALLGAATWGAYSVAIVPLLRRYSVWRISAGALLIGAVPLVVTALPQLADQRWDLTALVWAGFAFAVLGPLVLTNVLWFTAIDRVGPSRATLVTNLQPFLAALFAVVLLSEELTWLQVAGGVAIGVALRSPDVAPPSNRPKMQQMSAADFMPLKGWDHVELWVGNAKQAAYFYEHAFGFTRTAYAGPETGVRDRASYVLEQGDIRFVFTSGVRPDSEITQFACRHGDAAKVIALQVPSATEAYRQAIQRGARGIREPESIEDEFGVVELASIGTYGENIHTFVNRDDYSGPFLPGYRLAVDNGQPAAGVGLIMLDHVVGNVELGRMNHWVEFYERVFGMTNIVHFGDDQIQTEYSALMSKVMADGSGKIKFPINEPAEGKRKSQIEEYLEFNGGPGVQHIAMQSEDIVGTVEAMKERGVIFLDTPETYYEEVEERVGEISEDYADLKRLRILADRDEDGYLLQIFTKTAQDRPTLFFEVIERHGATTFGEGNFKALFESIEREQALRGNL